MPKNRTKSEILIELEEAHKRIAELEAVGEITGQSVKVDITEHTQTEESQRERDELYQLLFEGMTQGVVFQDAEGRLLHANPAAEAIMGLTLQEMRGKKSISPNWSIIKEDGSVLPVDEHPVMRVLSSGRPVNNIVIGVFNPKKKIYIWLNINAFPRFNGGDSKPYQVFTIFEDITAQKQVELELRESEQGLRSMLEVSQAMAASLEMDTVLQKIIENATGLLQLDSGAIYTLEGDQLFLEATTPPLPPGFPDELRCANVKDHPHIHAAISSGTAIALADTTTAELSGAEKMAAEARGLRSIIYVPLMISEKAIGVFIVASVNRIRTFKEEEIALYSGFSGQAAQTIVNTRLYTLEREYAAELEMQINERKQAEAKLRESESRYRLIAENSADVIWVLDPTAGKFTYVSPSVQKLRGYTPEEVMVQPMNEVLTAESLKRVSESLASNLPLFSEKGSGTASFISEVDQPCKDGSIVNTEVTTTYLFNEQGNVEIVGVSRNITERKRAEENLRDSEKKYRDLLNGMSDSVWVIDADMSFLDINETAVKALGYSRDELLLMKVSDIDDAIEPAQIQALIDRLQEEKLQIFETRHKTKDGRVIPVEVSSSLVAYMGHTVIMSISRDITERKQFESALIASEKKFKSLVDSQTHFVIRVNMQGNYTYWNSRFEKEFGWIYQTSDLRNIPVMTAVCPHHHERVREVVEKCIFQPGQVFSVEIDKPARDGGVRTTLWEFVCLTDENNQPLEIQCMGIEITERKRIEKQLIDTERYYRALIENAPDGIVLIDVTGKFKYASPSVKKLFGYEQDEAMGGDPNAMTHPDDLPTVINELAALIEDPSRVPTLQYRFKHKNGEWRWIESTFSNLLALQGVEAIIINFRDIHERKLTEEALGKSQALLTEAQRIGRIGHMEWIGKDSQLICSDELYDILELPRGTTITKQVIGRMMLPGEEERIHALEMQVIRMRTDMDYEYRILTEGGKEKWLHQIGKATYGEDGQPVRMMFIVQDITERKQVEEQLREEQLRFAQVAATIPGVICTFKLSADGSFSVPYASMGFEDLFGLKVEDVFENVDAILEKLSPEQVTPLLDAVQESAVNLTPWRNEFYYKHPHKGWVWLEGYSMPIRQADGCTIWHGVTTDITERKQVEETLRNNEERLRTVADFTYDMEFWMDETKTLAYISPSCERITGYKREQFLNEPALLQKIVHPEDRSTFDQHSMEEFELQGSCSLDFRILTVDGEVRWINHTCQAVTGADGNFRGRRVSHRDITERRHALQELRASEEKYRGLLESLDSVVASIDLEGKFLYMNDTAAGQLGGTPEQFIGMNMYELFPEPVADLQMRDIRTVVAGDKGRVFENPSMINGKLRWYRTSIQPLHDENGQVFSVLVNSTDIHDLKATQQELLELNRTLEEKVAQRTAEVQDLYENAPTGYHSINAEGKFVRVNETELNWLGYTREEMIGHAVIDMVTESTRNVFRENFPLLLQRGWVKDVEFEFTRKDGSALPVLLSATAIYDEASNFIMSRSTIFDNTERKLAENAIRESEATYRALFENSNDGIFLMTSTGEELRANQRALAMVGYTLEEYLTLGHINQNPFAREEDQRKDADEKLDALLRGETVPLYERIFTAKDGHKVPVEVNLSPVRDENGKIIMVQSVVRDIAERKAAEEALRSINKELERALLVKDEFLANMSHELRTPLNGILGFSEILLSGQFGSLSERQNKYISSIENSGKHLLGLINDLLDLAKIEAGKLDVTLENVVISELCQSSLMFVKQMALNKSIQLSFEQDMTYPYVVGDQRRLKQILVNLLSNAVKFTPEHGKVTLRIIADPGKDCVDFAVEDTGIGISQEDLLRLFKPFTQVDSSLTRQHEGTGLGLALVQKLAELHGGGITVQSEVGKGSTFTVCIPVRNMVSLEEQKEKTIIPEHVAPTRQGGARFGKILLAEDTESNIVILGDYLEHQGYELFYAKNGQEALERAKETPPDLILMDIQMPVMDGLVATRRLRADPRFATVPIIALTALAMTGDRERCLEAGATEYVSKPANLKKLTMMIANLLKATA